MRHNALPPSEAGRKSLVISCGMRITGRGCRTDAAYIVHERDLRSRASTCVTSRNAFTRDMAFPPCGMKII